MRGSFEAHRFYKEGSAADMLKILYAGRRLISGARYFLFVKKKRKIPVFKNGTICNSGYWKFGRENGAPDFVSVFIRFFINLFFSHMIFDRFRRYMIGLDGIRYWSVRDD